MSLLKSALELAEMGFYVHPLRPNTKIPAKSGWQQLATRDPAKIKEWWTACPTYNIGISTSNFGDNGALVVVDVDNKGEKHGSEEIIRLELEGKDFPETYSQRTPSGGTHLFYKVSQALKQGTDVLASGVDIRSRGGNIAGRGSLIDGRIYEGTSSPIALAPQWLIEKLGTAPEKTEAVPIDLTLINEEQAIQRAIYYLKHEAPESIKGLGGDSTAYKVAARVKDFGVDADTCLELMLDHWFEGSGWSPEKLQIKIENAYRYGANPVGAAAPEAAFTPLDDDTPEERESYLRKLNKEYALIYIEGSHFVLHETVDMDGKKTHIFLSEATFRRRFSPHTVQQGKSRPRNYADIWLDWKGRREYKGVCFTPEKEPNPGFYNLWKGFTCEPTPPASATLEARMGVDMFLDHALKNVCRGDKKLFHWLIGYFAHMIQRPYERPLTTLVFRGRKGTGKNALIDRVGNLLGGESYLVAHDGRYLTSNFNGHLDSCLCLVLDEAFWSGDKNAEGKLKGLTTAPKILIERKGKEPYKVANLVRIIVVGNESWLVPASADERRWAVFDVGEERMQDREFFHTMRVLIDEKGGNSVLLHYLQNFDLRTVDVNAAPKTEALLDQKTASLDPFHQWWLDCLTEGCIVGSDFTGAWPTDMSKEAFRSSFSRYLRDRNIRSRIPEAGRIGHLLKAIVPSLDNAHKKMEGGVRFNVYRFPDLDQCRSEWELFIGQKVNWD